MSHWRSNPIVEDAKGKVEYHHLHIPCGETRQLFATVGSVAAPDGSIAVGIGMKSRRDQGSRALGRAVSNGRALRALAVHLGTTLPSGDPTKSVRFSNVVKSEVYFHLFLLMAYSNPKKCAEALAAAIRFSKDFPDVSEDDVKALRDTALVTGNPSIAMLEATLRAQAASKSLTAAPSEF